jgi:competence ComEA-like helix-hairpin-helix protein
MKQDSPETHLCGHLFLAVLCCVATLACSCGNLAGRYSSRSDSSSIANAKREAGDTRININAASIGDLEKLPGIGKVMAERIVAHREQYGAFRRAEHLMMVQGMSDNKFRKIQPLVTVE